MSRPKAYCPEPGYQYQILCRYYGTTEWEHCDYAVDRTERDYLLSEYKLAYRTVCEFKCILLPKKYWN